LRAEATSLHRKSDCQAVQASCSPLYCCELAALLSVTSGAFFHLSSGAAGAASLQKAAFLQGAAHEAAFNSALFQTTVANKATSNVELQKLLQIIRHYAPFLFKVTFTK
jgi:hypothetical protein